MPFPHQITDHQRHDPMYICIPILPPQVGKGKYFWCLFLVNILRELKIIICTISHLFVNKLCQTWSTLRC